MKLNLHSDYNWSLKQGNRFSYVIVNKNFPLLYGDDYLYFRIIIDGRSTINIPPSGNYPGDNINVTTSSMNFDDYDYIQVMHTITNKDNRSHTIDVGLYIDLKLNNQDIINFQNINESRGANAYMGDKNVTFLLRHTAFVTDVDGYAPSSKNEWWPDTKYANGIYGSLTFCWKNRNLNIGETKQFSYLVGTGNFNAAFPQTQTKYNIKALILFFNKIPCFCFLCFHVIDKSELN